MFLTYICVAIYIVSTICIFTAMWWIFRLLREVMAAEQERGDRRPKLVPHPIPGGSVRKKPVFKTDSELFDIENKP